MVDRWLRDEAKKALGDAFDIRAFHDEVLGAGALPMDVLERRIHAWIDRTRAAGGGMRSPTGAMH